MDIVCPRAIEVPKITFKVVKYDNSSAISVSAHGSNYVQLACTDSSFNPSEWTTVGAKTWFSGSYSVSFGGLLPYTLSSSTNYVQVIYIESTNHAVTINAHSMYVEMLFMKIENELK